MVFTQAKDIDVLDNDQFIMILMEDRTVHNIPQILFVSFCEKHHGFCIPLWSVTQSFAIWILADAFKDCAHRVCKFALTFFRFLWGSVKSLFSANT
jgi:hypothetical protein